MNLKQAVSSKQNVIQFIKFAIVGLSNTVMALLVYYGLLFVGVNYLIANVVSWIVSVFNAFYWNNKYVFANDSTWFRSLIKTYISYGVSFLLGTTVLFALVEWCRVSTVIAPLWSLVITIPLNFFMNKFWTFR